MGFVEAITYCFKNYANFSGRAQRSQFWFFFLFNILVSVAINVLITATGVKELIFLSGAYSLAILVPYVAVAVRRLHDIGKSGWFVLLFLIPCIGLILMIVWCGAAGTAGPNEYGENPLASAGGAPKA